MTTPYRQWLQLLDTYASAGIAARADLGAARGILVSLTSGTTEILPAPPAGYVYCLTGLRVTNTHASNAISWALVNSDGDYIRSSSLAALTSATMIGNASSNVSWHAKAVSVVIGGTGGPAVVVGQYYLVPTTSLAMSALALTSSFQTWARAVPSVGGHTLGLDPVGGEALTGSCIEVTNSDNQSHVIRLRHVRGSVTYVHSLVSQGTLTRVAVNPQLGVILPGDTLEAATTAAVNSAGSVMLRAVWRAVK